MKKGLIALGLYVLMALPLAAAGWLPLFVATSGGGGCTQATTYLTAVGSQSTNYTNAMTTLICGAVTDGWWSKLDAFYFLKAHTSATALVNAVNPGTYNASATGSPTFTVDVGYTGIGTTTDYLTSNFNPSTAPSPNYTSASALVGVAISVASESVEQCPIGYNANTFLDAYFVGTTYWAINMGTQQTFSAPASLVGTWLETVVSSSSQILYFGGSSLSAASQSPTTPSSANIIFLKDTFGDTSTATLAIALIGGAITSTDATNITNRIATYESSVP